MQVHQNKKGQKYQNQVGYAIKSYNIKGQNNLSKAPLDRLCPRCLEQMEWKLKFDKYKKMKDIAKCQSCNQKNIVKSYRKVCDQCADSKKICSKCTHPIDQFSKSKLRQEKKSEQQKELVQIMEDYLSCLRQRSHRKITRLLENDLIEWSREKCRFVYKENTERKVEELKYKRKFKLGDDKQNPNVGELKKKGSQDDLDDDDDDIDFGEEDLEEGDEDGEWVNERVEIIKNAATRQIEKENDINEKKELLDNKQNQLEDEDMDDDEDLE